MQVPEGNNYPYCVRSPRCVVWTGDGRVFFYNPSTKTSVWERPVGLQERADGVKAISTVPEQLLATNPSNVVPAIRTMQNATQNREQEQQQVVKPVVSEEEVEHIPAKKPKTEGAF